MKKRILATIMTLTLGAAMLTACGSSADDDVTAPVETAVSTICKSCLRVAHPPERASFYDFFIIYSSFEI